MDHISKCNICGGDTEEKLRLGFRDVVGMADEWTESIRFCPKCGFIFVGDPFSAEQLESRYSSNSKYEYDGGGVASAISDACMERSERQRAFIERVLGKGAFSSILEIGAASGANLSLYDCERYGVEPSVANCENARRRYGVGMFCGTSDDFFAAGGEKKYDMVFLSHTLEHIVKPCDFIKKCAGVNGRYIFIEVPTLDYNFDDEPYGMFTDEHVNIFTLESLINLMSECGYSLIDAEIVIGIGSAVPSGYPAVSSLWEKRADAKLAAPVPVRSDMLDAYIALSEKRLKDISAVIEKIPDDSRIALWGIGNCASKLIANTPLRDKNIVRVYDSDKYKEGELFCGAEIHPFFPRDIEDGSVDTVVITTYTAQKTIEKLLAPYKGTVRVITLFDVK